MAQAHFNEQITLSKVEAFDLLASLEEAAWALEQTGHLAETVRLTSSRELLIAKLTEEQG